ncbi:uncharacterized protein TNCV_3295611 [Trichonephila clavipes]|uniref:Transposase n=1 Tax=Trichonephila clavipes TaxID=2585209 RepID=A0A8X6SXF7_TRICX|nr:uncharacterized protein TNCV_3295611 [Trichonephila clavipes]
MRQIARDVGISDRLVRRIAKTDHGLKPYKLRKVQLLSEKTKLVRLRKCRKVLRLAASQLWERFLFTDAKLFTVQQVHNSQNDRMWCVNAPSTSAIVEHRQYLKSVMIWGGICASGKTPLVSVGVKVNPKVYTGETLLKLLYFRGIISISEIQIGRFNKTALVCKAEKAQEGCKVNFPDMT